MTPEEWQKHAELHRACFQISQDEMTAYRDWEGKHLLEKHPTPASRYGGAAGGRVTWKFTPTGLGTFVSVVCNLCKEEKQLTNVEDM